MTVVFLSVCVFVTCFTAVIVVHCDHNINQRSDDDDDVCWGTGSSRLWSSDETVTDDNLILTPIVMFLWWFYLLGLSSALEMKMMKMMISLSRSHLLMNCHVKRCPASITRWSVAFNAFNHRFIRQAWPLITVALADSGILGHPRYVTPASTAWWRFESWGERACLLFCILFYVLALPITSLKSF